MITLNARVQIPVEIMAAHKLEYGSGMPPDLLNYLAASLGKQLIEANCVEFETRNNNSMSMLEIIVRARVLELDGGSNAAALGFVNQYAVTKGIRK